MIDTDTIPKYIHTPKYIDKGSYGCVFKPSIPCPGKKQKKKTISKIFRDNYEAKKEWNESRIVKSIDKYNKFTLSPTDYCKIDRSIIGNKINDCGYKWSFLNSWSQIIYPDGGHDFSSKNIQEYNFLDILNSLTPIINGIVTIKNKGFCHFDIKPLNIVYNNSINKASLIDFGLLESLKNIYTKERIDYFSRDYMWYPPESRLYSYYNSQKSIFTYQNIDNIALYIEVDNRNCNVEFFKLLQLIYPQTYRKINIVNDHPIKNIEDMLKYILPKIKNLNQNALSSLFYKNFASKFDIFSMGITLLEIFNIYFSNKKKYFHLLTNNDKKILMLIINWIYKARHNNVYERYTPEEAAHDWLLICDKINKYSKSYSKSFKSIIHYKNN